ncbi:MAG: PIN domain-containing protein [Acidobacteriota bacterium]
MTAPVFVDTNVLVYARDAAAGEKQEKAAAWMRHLWTTRAGRISVQVLQEFYVTVTRKLHHPVPSKVAREDIRDLMAWHPVPMNGALLERAFPLEDRHRLSFWDSLVVAAAAAAGCSVLLSEDLQHGQDLDGVRVQNPFLLDP